MSPQPTEAAPYGAFALRGFSRWAVERTRSFPDVWLARKAIILMRRLVLRRLGGAPVDIDALGVRMRLAPYANICEKRMLFAPATFDPDELQLLSDRVRGGYVFIDIGANVGVYALFVASRAGPTARILAIEPQPEIFERLVYNIRLNALATVKAVECAVADRSGEVTLFLDPKNSGESSVKLVNSSGARPIRIGAKTLLELLADEGFARIDAMKLDVEGAEDLVLEPFLQEAPEHLLPELLIIENGSRSWQADLVSLLGGRGYRRLMTTRLNLVFERKAGNA